MLVLNIIKGAKFEPDGNGQLKAPFQVRGWAGEGTAECLRSLFFEARISDTAALPKPSQGGMGSSGRAGVSVGMGKGKEGGPVLGQRWLVPSSPVPHNLI